MAANMKLEDRMKGYYENRAKTFLTRRTPVIIRIDGKAFHTFTKGFKKPYDEIFHSAMNETMKYLCQNVQGCKFGFTQSDEISLLLTDYDTLTTDAWFDYNVQKMCSIVASMATLKFSQFFRDAVNEYFSDKIEDYDYHKTMCLARDKGAMFDARCFNMPANEVKNYFIWRQTDGTRNAINMLGRTYFSDKQMHGLSTSDVQEKLFAMHGINFNDMPVPFKRGMACIRIERPTEANSAVLRKVWHLAEPCIFTNDVNFIMAEI